MQEQERKNGELAKLKKDLESSQGRTVLLEEKGKNFLISSLHRFNLCTGYKAVSKGMSGRR